MTDSSYNSKILQEILREPTPNYDSTSQPKLFGENELIKGDTFQLQDNGEPSESQIIYSNSNGALHVGDSIEWLKSLETGSVDLVIADPPYNIKKAKWDSFESQQAYVDWSLKWIEQAARILKPTGTLYVCGFSEILADIKLPALRFFKGCRWIIWHYKNKANLRSDWGRSHESILHFRKSSKFTFNIDDVRIPYGNHTTKYPERIQADSSQYGNGKSAKSKKPWHPHPKGAKPRDVIEIPTTCNGMNETTPHPTQKPEELFRKLVLASSNERDLIVDPFSGSGTTAVVAEQLNRQWKCCDKSKEYCGWAIERVELVKPWSIEQWVEHDRNNANRRKAIR